MHHAVIAQEQARDIGMQDLTRRFGSNSDWMLPAEAPEYPGKTECATVSVECRFSAVESAILQHLEVDGNERPALELWIVRVAHNRLLFGASQLQRASYSAQSVDRGFAGFDVALPVTNLLRGDAERPEIQGAHTGAEPLRPAYNPGPGSGQSLFSALKGTERLPEHAIGCQQCANDPVELRASKGFLDCLQPLICAGDPWQLNEFSEILAAPSGAGAAWNGSARRRREQSRRTGDLDVAVVGLLHEARTVSGAGMGNLEKARAVSPGKRENFTNAAQRAASGSYSALDRRENFNFLLHN